MNRNLATPDHVPPLGLSPVSRVLIVSLTTYRNLTRHWLELDLSGPAANALSDSSFALKLRTDHSLCFSDPLHAEVACHLPKGRCLGEDPAREGCYYHDDSELAIC